MYTIGFNMEDKDIMSKKKKLKLNLHQSFQEKEKQPNSPTNFEL